MKLNRNEKYFKLGVTAFLVLVAVAIFWVIFSNLSGFYDIILEFFSIISPLIYGAIFAYLMNPVMEYSAKGYKKLLAKTKLSEKRVGTIAKSASLITALLVFFAAVYALVALIVPNLIESVTELINEQRIDGYYKTILHWVHDTFSGTPIEAWFNNNLEGLLQTFTDFVKGIDFMGIILGVFTSAYSVFATVFNILIGVVAAAYFLIYKNKLCSQAKKIATAMLRSDRANRLFEIARRTNRIFGGFVVGKIIDAVFVGVVTYFALLIMGMPFAPLIAVIIGVTNIIPFFGPFLGAVPSGLLLLIDNPMNAVYFAIFIVVLQMIDGNIVENRILGEKLGISDFWVLVAILISGGVFGFGGMLLGVPIFAVIYTLITDAVNKRLANKRYPIDSELYYNLREVEDLPIVPRETTRRHPQEPNYDLNVEVEDAYDAE